MPDAFLLFRNPLSMQHADQEPSFIVNKTLPEVMCAV